MSASLPILRASIELNEQPEKTLFAAQLVDSELGQSVRLDARAYQVAQLLRLPQTVDGLASQLETTVEVVEKVLNLFTRMHLLDTESSELFVAEAQQTRAWQEGHPEEIPLLIRDEAAFSCTMCGSCCGGHNVGPVSAEVVAGLKDKRQALLARTGSSKGLFFAVPVGQDGQVEDQIVCHSRSGSCVFLSGDRRCVIHEDYGAEYKPEVCRLFPYQFVATPKGIAVSLSMECRGFAEAKNGQALKNQEAGLRDLLNIVPNLRRVRPILLLDDLNPIAYGEYETIENDLHDLVDQHQGQPIQTLLAMRERLFKAQERDCTAEIAECDATTLRSHFSMLMQHTVKMAEALVQQYGKDDSDALVHTETLGELAAAATSIMSDLPRVVGPLDRPSHGQLFQQVMHHQLMGKELTQARSVVLGMARLSYSWFMSYALMIARARQVKRRHLVEQDVMDGVVVMSFLLRNQGFMDAFHSCDDAIVSLFYERLPALLVHAGEIAGLDGRVEFYKF